MQDYVEILERLRRVAATSMSKQTSDAPEAEFSRVGEKMGKQEDPLPETVTVRKFEGDRRLPAAGLL